MSSLGKAVLVLFGLVLSNASARAALVDKIVAVVNGDVVLLSDVERFERTINLRRELDPLFGFSEAMETASPSRVNVIDFLIQERLIGQTFKIADSEVEQEVSSVQRANNLDREQLRQFLASQGYTFNEYFELMRMGLAKRNLLDREIRTRVNVSDDDVKNYFFNMALKTSTVPLEYRLQLIVVSFSTYKTLKGAEDAAQSALRAVRQGESFEEVARRASDDPSAENGGDLGYFSTEALAEPLRGAVRKLQIGQISDVVRGPNGFMIIKLIDARSTETEKLAEMREQIREQLAKEEYKKQLFIWAERARNNAFVHMN